MFALLRYKLLHVTLLGCLVASVCLVAAPGASANDRSPSGDFPFYAAPFANVSHDNNWAAIPFYRPPDCVPAGFNLLTLFDIPAAFACTPPTTEGFEISKDGVPVPWVWQLHGLGAVPMYFVGWPELQSAMADGVLMIGELESLHPFVRGTASIFKQTVRNEASGAIVVVQVTARGVLADGRAFQVESTMKGDGRQSTHIAFR